jgi:hypothetical protein
MKNFPNSRRKWLIVVSDTVFALIIAIGGDSMERLSKGAAPGNLSVGCTRSSL